MGKVEEYVENADHRPGFNIVNYREVALPIFKVQPLITLQAQSSIGPIEEFIYKLLNQNIDNPDEISLFLGLPKKIIDKQLGALVYEGMVVARNNKKNQFSLSKKGIQQYRDLKKTSIVKDVVPFYVDGITREVVPVTSHSLYRNKEIKDLGMAPVPPIPRQTPRGTDLDINQMNHVLDVMSGDRELDKKIIKVDALVDKNHLFYRPAIALAFKSESGRSISIGFIIDGILSKLHEDMFMRGDEAKRSTIFGDMFDSGRRRQEIQKVSKELQTDILLPNKSNEKQQTNSKTRRKLTLDGVNKPIQSNIEVSQVKTLSVYEHPIILDQALTEAERRLLIISPWIRGNVVNDSFLSKLTDCLNRNVDVTIAYGISRKDKGANDQDMNAEKLLKKLSDKYANFQLKRKGNTHAKVLIKDSDFFVTTSFNWLSFRGDPKQPFREEEGTYVTGDTIVNEYYNRLMKRVNVK